MSDSVKETCNFESCNQEMGHDGPHGFAVEGLVFAPYGGGEGRLLEWQEVGLRCDCCGSTMKLQRYEKGGGSFKCTSSSCHQYWRFTPDGATCAVIASLYPHRMTNEWPLYDKYLDYKLEELKFTAEAKRLCGLFTLEEATAELGKGERECADLRAKKRVLRAIRRLTGWTPTL